MDGSRIRQAMLALRVLVAAMLLIHGAWRLTHGGVEPFGEFLDGSGIPAGRLVAWMVTIVELTGSVALAAGYLVRPLALYFSAELLMGIALVHAPEGWFVVGGGRNGMEYSVVLIGILLAQAWAAAGGRERASSR